VIRIRLKYSTQGKVRYISHLDLMRVFFKACSRAHLPVALSQGFSPHLKLSFGPPLSLGITSSGEYVDIYLTESVDVLAARSVLQDALPEGLAILDLKEISMDGPSIAASLCRAEYKIDIPADKVNILADRLKLFSNSLVRKIGLDGNYLLVDVSIGQNGNVRPIDVLKGLFPEEDENELKLWKVNRERIYC